MDFNVTDYGAEPNTGKIQTESFQQALNECSSQGGGRVIVPSGRYIIGSIRIFSNTTFHLEGGVVLQGTTDLNGYQTFGEEPHINFLHDPEFINAWHLPPYYFHALIAAYDAHDICIEGEPGSVIDGQDIRDPEGEEHFRGPMGLVLSQVKNLTLKGYSVIHSANWSHLIEGCTPVNVSGVKIFGGHDGLNLYHSTNINIDNCYLQTGDDCMAGYDVEHLQVTNCWLNTACNVNRLSGKDINFSNCTVIGPGVYPHRVMNEYHTHALLTYFAFPDDPNRSATSSFSYSNMQVRNLDRILVYDDKDLPTDADPHPIESVSFSNMQFSKVKRTSACKANRFPVTLRFENCQIEPTDGVPFLEIGQKVHLDLNNVVFTQPTTIIDGNGGQIVLDGLNTIQLDRL